MRKNVQISFSLFMDLLDYFVLEISEAEAYERIVDGLNQKIDKMIMHDLYEKYKTAPTEGLWMTLGGDLENVITHTCNVCCESRPTHFESCRGGMRIIWIYG